MYASVADMVERFGEIEIVELTDLEHTGEIDSAMAERALTDATAEIDGYLAARYRLPVTDAPRLLSLLCTDIARFRLQKGVSTEQARQRYEDAVRKLERIADGRINLPLATPPPASAEPVVRQGRRVFDDDALRGW
jgi:phage gp36-like protein